MRVFDAVRNLKAFRSSEDRVVPRDVIGRVIEAGRHAPSPGNVQSLEFIVVEDDRSLNFLADKTGDQRLEEVPTAVVVLGDLARMRRQVGPSGSEIACYSEAACAAQNMRLVAEEEDISSCWVTGFDQVAVKTHFNIPEEKQPLGVVALCFSDDEIESEERFGIGDIVFYDNYENRMRSNFDNIEWKGIDENRRIVSKRFAGLRSKIRKKLGDIL